MANQKVTTDHPSKTSSDNEHSKLAARIDALESRNAFQDDVIEQLNQELAIHQTELADLKLQLRLLAGRMKDIKGSSIAGSEEELPPPHY